LIGELGLDLAAHLAKGVLGDADTAGFGNAFEPGGDIHTVAKDVVSLDQHIADVDADAPFHAAIGSGLGIPLVHQPLQRQGAFDGADHRTKLDQQAITGGFHDPPAVLRDQRISGAAVLA